MATYDITSEVKELATRGITWDEIKAALGSDVAELWGGYHAYSRSGERAFAEYYERATTVTGTYIKVDGAWCIKMRASQYTEGVTVTMKLRSGETKTATAGTVIQHDGDTVIVREAAAYRTKTSSLYGTGRVYADQPGATEYHDGFGTVQIWDES